jgi:hypothetical protein
MNPTKPLVAPGGWRRLARNALALLPELMAFGGALLFAALGAVLVGSLGGCGGGVGSEGTGSFASSYSSGPISGFGSIVVNGVHYDESAASVADDDGQALDRGALALGMVVQVSAGAVTTAANGTQVASASTVRTARALVGPASALQAAAGRVQVLGQAVLVTADTVLPDSLVGGLAGVMAGQVLEVYGFYDISRAAYVATRIAPAPAAALYRISGPVITVDGSQSFSLGGQRFAGATAGLVPGAQLRLSVQAQPDADGRWVVSTQRSDDRPPDDRERAGLEGVVSTLASTSRFVVGGVTVDSSAARIEGQVQVGARVEVHGSLRAGVLVASEVKAAVNGGARSFELKGTPSRLDTVARRFVVRSVTVSYARAGLVFKNGDAAKLLGYAGTLEVKGMLSADRTVLEATQIEFD